MGKTLKTWIQVVAVLLIVALIVVVAFWWQEPQVTERTVREAVVTTIQSEAEEAFLVTGVLTITATSTVESTDYLLPRSFRIRLGSTQARVRMPGHVTYGFPVEAITADMIRLTDDGVVEVDLPPLQPYSVEANFDSLQVQTSTGGWQRWVGDPEQRDAVQQRAMRSAYSALRLQAARHLRTATQPRINTASALEQLLRPVLQAAGIEDPRFRFEVSPGIHVTPPE